MAVGRVRAPSLVTMPDKRMSLILPEELWKKLGHLAVEENKSKNDLILDLIQKALKTEEFAINPTASINT
jgi:hypothetical protein